MIWREPEVLSGWDFTGYRRPERRRTIKTRLGVRNIFI
jgi:hypothetical protein